MSEAKRGSTESARAIHARDQHLGAVRSLGEEVGLYVGVLLERGLPEAVAADLGAHFAEVRGVPGAGEPPCEG